MNTKEETIDTVTNILNKVATVPDTLRLSVLGKQLAKHKIRSSSMSLCTMDEDILYLALKGVRASISISTREITIH